MPVSYITSKVKRFDDWCCLSRGGAPDMRTAGLGNHPGAVPEDGLKVGDQGAELAGGVHGIPGELAACVGHYGGGLGGRELGQVGQVSGDGLNGHPGVVVAPLQVRGGRFGLSGLLPSVGPALWSGWPTPAAWIAMMRQAIRRTALASRPESVGYVTLASTNRRITPCLVELQHLGGSRLLQQGVVTFSALIVPSRQRVVIFMRVVGCGTESPKGCGTTETTRWSRRTPVKGTRSQGGSGHWSTL